jgi:hypothetical protein
LKIFPIPIVHYQTLWFQYVKLEETRYPYAEISGSVITTAMDVPYANPTYSNINSIGRSWIFEYALALAKEMLGYVRGKYTTVPIPGSEITLNQSDLITAATSEKNALVERLRVYLDSTSRKALLEKKAAEAENQKNILADVPMTIFVG